MIWHILYIFQHDRRRCLGQVVGHRCRRRNQVNMTVSRGVKCLHRTFKITSLGKWTYNFLHILYSISSLGETQQFCGDYIFSGHTGCLILAYLVVSHNLHDILDLKRGDWSLKITRDKLGARLLSPNLSASPLVSFVNLSYCPLPCSILIAMHWLSPRLTPRSRLKLCTLSRSRFSLLLFISGISALLAGRGHYTIDVVFGYWVMTR